MYRRLILMVVVLGFSATLFGQVNPGSLPEKYVKKVIIEAKWGSGPGEFGMNVYSDPPSGPGNLVIDGGNLYIYDWANSRIYKYNTMGNFKKIIDVSEEEKIVNFTVKDDTLYGVVFPVSSEVEKIMMINTRTGKKIKTLEVKLPVSHQILDIHKRDEKIVITRGAGEEEERYSLEVTSKKGGKVAVSTNSISKPSERFVKIDKREGKLVLDGRRFLISKTQGTTLFDVSKLAEDKNGNVYVSVWSENRVGAPEPRVFQEIFKYSPAGKLLAKILLPQSKNVSKDLAIGNNGDIFYLYATGNIIVKDWKMKFIPGKIQVIKWKLQE